jgi:hypothetical protein
MAFVVFIYTVSSREVIRLSRVSSASILSDYGLDDRG